jgi:hypothetical protein
MISCNPAYAEKAYRPYFAEQRLAGICPGSLKSVLNFGFHNMVDSGFTIAKYFLIIVEMGSAAKRVPGRQSFSENPMGVK